MASPEVSSRGRPVRVFFALWPEPAIARRLHASAGDAHALAGGRRMRRDTLHMTLAFIGEIQPDRLDALRMAAERVVFAPFTLSLDRLAAWRHNRIVWAGASEVPAELQGLVAQLNANLKEGGFRVEDRKFAAHVTLVRKAVTELPPAPIVPPIDWPVRSFALMKSDLLEDGAHYSAIGTWPAKGA